MTSSDVVWRPIEGFENSYEVSSDGRVRGIDRIVERRTSPRFVKGVEIKTKRSNSGYQFVLLRRNGKQYPRYVHRLVAKAFVPNPNNWNTVNHLDEDKDNNIASNLEWCTHGQNMIHAGGSRRRVLKRMKPVVVISDDGQRKAFESVNAAADFLKCSPSAVSRCCRHIKGTRHVHGYTVTFME